MTIQVIITGNSAAEVQHVMAGFLAATPAQIEALPAAASTEPEPNGAVGGETHEAPKKRVRSTKPKAEPEPEKEVETEAETAAADDADEVEVATEATADDVRAALTEFYLEKYGREATQADILKLYKMRFPDGSVTKVSDIPDGMHGQVVADIQEMSTKNPFKRKPL